MEKRYTLIISGTGEVIHSDSKEELEQMRRKKGAGKIFDNKTSTNNRVLRASNVNERSTRYNREQEEKQYNGLSFKQAYEKARSNKVKYFGYKGKVYSSDLKDGRNNMTEMMSYYGNNLGYDKDPRLQNKASRRARENYRNRELRVSSPKVDKEAEKRKELERVKKESLAQFAKDFNAAKFVDAVMPTNLLGNTVDAGIDYVSGEDYTPRIHKSGFNPFGYAEDVTNGNVGGLAVRGIDAYTTLGMPGARKVIDWAGTKWAPQIFNISSKSKYIVKGGTDPVVDEAGNVIARVPNKWNVWSLTRGSRNPGVAGESAHTVAGESIKEYGNRSVQRAVSEGVLPATDKGAASTARWANAAWQNANTGDVFFFRSPGVHPYDYAIDKAIEVVPYWGVGANAATQAIDVRRNGGRLISRNIIDRFKNKR